MRSLSLAMVPVFLAVAGCIRPVDVHLADSQQGGGLFTLEQQRCKAGAWGVGIGFIRSIRG